MLPGLLAKGKKWGGEDAAPFFPSEPVETSLLATHTGSIIFPGSLLGKKSCRDASNPRAQDKKGFWCSERQIKLRVCESRRGGCVRVRSRSRLWETSAIAGVKARAAEQPARSARMAGDGKARARTRRCAGGGDSALPARPRLGWLLPLPITLP